MSKSLNLKIAFAGLALAAGLAVGLGGRAALRGGKPATGETWHRDAAGFRAASALRGDDAKPMLVYFYTDW